MRVTDDAAVPSPAASDRDRSALAPDVHARDWARTRTSDATTPPPAPALAAVEAAGAVGAGGERPSPAGSAPQGFSGPSARPPVRALGAPARPPLVVQGGLALLTAGLLAAAASGGQVPLVAAVVALQGVLVLAVLALLDAPAAGGAAVVACGAGLAADALVVLDEGQVDRLAGVVGLAFVVSLLSQLVRARRSRVTESLADTLLAVVLAVSAACLAALLHADGGEQVLLGALGAAAAAQLVGRLGDRVLPRPALAPGATRGWAGLLLGLACGAGATVGVVEVVTGELSPAAAALLGLAVAATVATADLAVDLGAAELRPGRRDARRVAALSPAAALLPYAVLGPVALLAGRLVPT